MSLADLVTVSITATSNLPTLQGFGVPLVVAYHNLYTDRIRYYSSLTAMVTDGFLVTDSAYLAASAILAQSPNVTQFGVGRRALGSLQTLVLTLTSTSTLDTYKATFVDSAGSSHTLSVASTGTPSTDAPTVATAISGFTLAGCTVTHTGATVTLTHTAGHLTDIQGWQVNPSNAIFTLVDSTADPGIATDLAALLAADGTGWYGFTLDSNSSAEILAAAAWNESNKRFFITNNSDTICGTSSTSDVMSSAQTSAYTRTGIIFSASQIKGYSGGAALGRILPQSAGSYSLAYKTLTGVKSDVLTETQTNNIITKSGNYYTTYKSVPILFPGVSPGAEFLDIVLGVDALTDRIQTDIFGDLVAAAKIPYTDAGVDTLVATIYADLAVFVNPPYNFLNGGDATTPAPTVSAPTVASQSASNRAKRDRKSVV